MKVLHIAPHLGGGVGKAHAAMETAFRGRVEQTFLLLERPRDRRHVDRLESAGARVVTAEDLEHVASLAGEADIVQFEFWNHPRLFECLARCTFPAIRTVFWSHISGLATPIIQPALIEEAGRFVFTTEASRSISSLSMLSESARNKIAVINSGFGVDKVPHRSPVRGEKPIIAYLGTVDFIKMHPGFFNAIDQLAGDAICVKIWGNASPAAISCAQSMRHPERICFAGWTEEPELALSEAEIFFYPLQPHHYGTAENALVEAMSLGLVPVVLDNPAEKAIIRHGETGFVGRSIHECASLLQMLLQAPDLRSCIGQNAIRDAAEKRNPERSAREFTRVWQLLREEPVRCPDFRKAIGDNPADWFLATQCLPGENWEAAKLVGRADASKGVLAHFDAVFPGDASLRRLAAQPGLLGR